MVPNCTKHHIYAADKKAEISVTYSFSDFHEEVLLKGNLNPKFFSNPKGNTSGIL